MRPMGLDAGLIVEVGEGRDLRHGTSVRDSTAPVPTARFFRLLTEAWGHAEPDGWPSLPEVWTWHRAQSTLYP